MQLNPNLPTVINVVDNPLSNGRSHSMSVTVWTVAEGPVEDQKRAARQLAIGFLERALLEMRRSDLN